MKENEYLVFKRIVADASHYIPGHPSCGSPHGHSYIIEDLTVSTFDGRPFKLDEQGISVDFGQIKAIIKNFIDHVNIVPEIHFEDWKEFYTKMGFNLQRLIPVRYTTCEFLARQLKTEFEAELGCEYRVHFRLFEGADDRTGGFRV